MIRANDSVLAVRCEVVRQHEPVDAPVDRRDAGRCSLDDRVVVDHDVARIA